MNKFTFLQINQDPFPSDFNKPTTQVTKMDLIAQLSQQYKSEFETKLEEIHKRSMDTIQQAQDTIQQLQPELQAKQEELVALVQETVSYFFKYFRTLYLLISV